MPLLWEQTLQLCLHVIEINGEVHVRDLNFASTSCSQIHNDSKINIISIQSKESLKWQNEDIFFWVPSETF